MYILVCTFKKDGFIFYFLPKQFLGGHSKLTALQRREQQDQYVPIYPITHVFFEQSKDSLVLNI